MVDSGKAMVFSPDSGEQVVEAVAWAAAEGEPLEVVGRASKRALGRPVQAAHSLDLSRLEGITLYEPEELVLSARAGTPLATIEAALAAQRQMPNGSASCRERVGPHGYSSVVAGTV